MLPLPLWGYFMFEINEQYCVTTTEKLLFNIWQEIKAMNEPATIEQVQPNLNELKRHELMALVKQLPKKPEAWSKLGNDQLKELLKEGA